MGVLVAEDSAGAKAATAGSRREAWGLWHAQRVGMRIP